MLRLQFSSVTSAGSSISVAAFAPSLPHLIGFETGSETDVNYRMTLWPPNGRGRSDGSGDRRDTKGRNKT